MKDVAQALSLQCPDSSGRLFPLAGWFLTVCLAARERLAQRAHRFPAIRPRATIPMPVHLDRAVHGSRRVSTRQAEACATLLALLAWLAPLGQAQLTLGWLRGSVRNARGPAAGARVEVEGPLGGVLVLHSGAQGEFSAALPYGVYTVRAVGTGARCRARVRALETVRCDLEEGQTIPVEAPGALSPGAYNAVQHLLFQTPGAIGYPLDFAGLSAMRLPFVSIGAAWTDTSFQLNGIDATDSYQPGQAVLLDDAAAVDSVVLEEGARVGVYLRGAENAWHGGLSTGNTGAAFAGNNLPPPADRGSVERPDEFLRFTRDAAEISGLLTRWADIAAAASGQWASQTAPQRADGSKIASRLLFGNVRGRVRLGSRDRLDALYSGSRVDLSSGGWPSGIQAILASPLMPSFYGVDGFENLRETDHFDLVQAGWAHQHGSGAFEFRYGYATAHLDTSPNATPAAPSQLDLLDPAPTAAPLSNFAVRTRHEIDAAYQSGGARLAGVTHSYALGGGWKESHPRNRFATPFGEDPITAAGQPAFVVRLNTPTDTRARIDSLRFYARDTLGLAHGVTLELAAEGDVARSVPAAISWTSPSPRVGIAVPAPRFPRLVLRGGYARTYSRLAGRYLDFADPDSLSGLVYNAQTGQLVERFGGAWSSIAPGLKRPYGDEFHTGLSLALPLGSAFSLDLLRRDAKDRLAAVNTGVPLAAYSPVEIRDPGPDFIPGTFDDQTLIVYAQNPSTLGQDRYLLSNPARLRELSEALTAALSARPRYAEVRLSFTAGKSFGPTNPGNSPWQNDPGIVGSLYSDPNTLLNATGHPFLDRAFLGKIQTVSDAPGWLGGVRVDNTLNYLDGLPSARLLLVTGLPPGPFLADTTLRGSPEGGNRAQYALNWNLRVSRGFPLGAGKLSLTAEVLNLLNNGNKLVENDLSGLSFNRKPALAIPPPRTLRLAIGWHF